MFGKEQGKRRLVERIAGVGVLLAVAFLTLVGAAGAQTPTTICVPETSSKPLLSTNAQGECPAQVEKKTEVKYKSVQLPGTGDLETLDKLLPHLKYEEQGVGGKPTIQVTGANLQIVSGSGKTNGPVNGAGNLVIGYGDEAECGIEILSGCGPKPRTGSHNLVLGTGQGYTSWGAILGGVANRSSAPGTFAIGLQNDVTNIQASVSGGLHNTASGPQASVSGGGGNVASSFRSSVSGGLENEAAGPRAWVGGGEKNTAGTADSNGEASVAGGINNMAMGGDSAILGGSKNKTTFLAQASSVSGGKENTASGERSSVSGGDENTASERFASVGGGFANTASGEYASVSGGQANTSSGRFSSILGGKANLVETEFGHFP
jgi:hypothetical protein